MNRPAFFAVAVIALAAPRLAGADEPTPAAPAAATVAPAPREEGNGDSGARIPGAAAKEEAGRQPPAREDMGPLVELSADDSRAALERRTGTTGPAGAPSADTGLFSVGYWEHACIAPCEVRLDPRYAYRVAGDGLVPTSTFALPRRGGDVRVDAHMGSTGGRTAGMFATGAGLAMVVAGGLAIASTPILESEDVGSSGLRSFVLAGGIGAVSVGVVTAGVGLFLWLTNGSTARTDVIARR